MPSLLGNHNPFDGLGPFSINNRDTLNDMARACQLFLEMYEDLMGKLIELPVLGGASSVTAVHVGQITHAEDVGDGSEAGFNFRYGAIAQDGSGIAVGQAATPPAPNVPPVRDVDFLALDYFPAAVGDWCRLTEFTNPNTQEIEIKLETPTELKKLVVCAPPAPQPTGFGDLLEVQT